MIPSKGQSNLPRPGAGIPPKRMPGPGAGARPGMPRPGFPMQTGPKPLTPTNIPETAHSIESPFSAEPRHEETHEPTSELTNPEENRRQSLVDTDEEPEIKMKKKHFEPKNFEERENTNEDEEPHTSENPNDNYVSLTESLKAMQSLRNNFVSFGEGFVAHDDDLGTPERTYKETDEEDYVKVESAEELPSKDLDDEHYDDEEGAHSPEEHHTIHGHRVIRDNYIEEIHEEPHEESRREDDEEEEEHEKQEPEHLLDHHNDTHEEITPQNIPRDDEDNQPENNDSEEEGPVTPTLGHQQEEIDPEGASSAHKIKEITSASSTKQKRDHHHHHEFLEKSDPEDNAQEKVMFIPHSNSAQVIQAIPNRSEEPALTASAKIREEKNKFLDDFEYGEEPAAPVIPVTTHTHDEPEIKRQDEEEVELLPPPKQVTEEKVIEKQEEEEEEITPPPPTMFVQTAKSQQQEEEDVAPPPTIATFTHDTKVQQEEEEEEILPPPKVLFIPQSAGSNKSKTVASSPFGITTTPAVKPESAKIKSPFTPSYKAPESATTTTKFENKIATPARFEPDVHVAEEDIDVPEGPETSLIVRLKKAEIELRKERVKNERIQSEKDSLLHENQSLKSEMMEIRSKLQTLEKSRDTERLAQKEQETIEKLKAELKSTIEGSRLVNEHSNRIINESTKYKQDIEAFINSLEEEKKELQQTIIQLKTQIHQENLKNETLTQKIEFLEQKSQEYEASFDLVQRRSKDRTQAFEKLTSLSENAKSTLESLPKVEDLISRIQPIQPVLFTTNVQTSTSQLSLAKDQGLQVTFEPKSSTTTEPPQKSATKPVNPFHVNKPTTPQKSVELHIQPPSGKTLDLPLQQKSVQKSHDFDDDLNLLLENESPLVKLNQPQSSTDKNKGSAKLGGRRIEESPTAFDKKQEEIEKDIERENEKDESLSTLLHHKPEPVTFGTMKKSPSKKEPTVSFSQNIPSLSKQKDELASKKQSAGLKATQWDLDESAVSLKDSVQLSESDVKDKPEESAPPKFTTPQSKKPVIPNFASNKISTEENKKKSGPLIIGKINNDQDKPSTTTTNKPKPVNFGNINLGKSGSRYTQPKKGLGGNIVADEADSFFDDLGVNETPSKGGNNTLRESVTSLRSSTSNVSRKIPPTNQFV